MRVRIHSNLFKITVKNRETQLMYVYKRGAMCIVIIVLCWCCEDVFACLCTNEMLDTTVDNLKSGIFVHVRWFIAEEQFVPFILMLAGRSDGMPKFCCSILSRWFAPCFEGNQLGLCSHIALQSI